MKPKTKRCPTCKGKGKFFEDAGFWADCMTCHGKKRVPFDMPFLPYRPGPNQGKKRGMSVCYARRRTKESRMLVRRWDPRKKDFTYELRRRMT